MKTRDLILIELGKIDRISLKDLSERINKKIDAISHQIKNLSKEGLVKTNRVRLGRSYITYVWLSVKNNIQLESIQHPPPVISQLEKTKNLQVEKSERSGDLKTPETDLGNLFNFDNKLKKIQVERLDIPTDILRGYYWLLTLNLGTGRGKSHRGNKNSLIDEIHKELDKQRGV